MVNLNRRRFLALSGFAALAANGCLPISNESEWIDPPMPLDPASGPMINDFAVNLYSKLSETKGNVFCSPFSISMALGMTATGAQGATLDQMRKVFFLPNEPLAADRRYRSLMAAVSGTDKPYELATANAIWAQQGFPWRTEFKDRVAQYGAGLRDADFVKQADAERQAVNRWVEVQTKQRIKELFQPRTVDGNTRMILANAIYFKGRWATEFNARLTKPMPFIAADGTKSDVPMMFRKAQFSLFTGDDHRVLSLPYKGNELSMLVALPHTQDGLAAVEKKLNAETIAQWTSQAKPTNDLQVYLPKFKIETSYKLNDTLVSMGMPDAFDGTKADFTAMHSSPERLFISIVVHKAYVDVSEEGTEAAAATGVGMARTAAPIAEPKVFKADHPFLFAIRHNESGAVLFLGRVAKP